MTCCIDQLESHMDKVIALILGGGKGTRLFPLTKDRSKPAVPLGGKYRIIDIPISNCINSDIRKMFVITQFNSKSLNHHINHAYRFDFYGSRFVDILAAEQTNERATWYQGTADAVRQNLRYILDQKNIEHVLILSGDQLYRMDFRKLHRWHTEQNADMTIATIPVEEDKVSAFGIMKTGTRSSGMRVLDFVEKPKEPKLISSLKSSPEVLEEFGVKDNSRSHLASMGIYLFNRDALVEELNKDGSLDFGHDIIPRMIREKEVAPYVFDGYWEDIGTIKAFHQANLDLVGENPRFELANVLYPLYTNPRFLPPAFIDGADIDKALIADGARIKGGRIHNSVVGIRSVVGINTVLNNVVMLGADYYETDFSRSEKIALGIGEGSIIQNAIIDKNARIGKNVRLENKKGLLEYDVPDKDIFIRDGILVIGRNGIVPDNTVL